MIVAVISVLTSVYFARRRYQH
ncbi:MAG: PGF-CTERM sorting domain-containing protein [Bacteroidales bacterium]